MKITTLTILILMFAFNIVFAGSKGDNSSNEALFMKVKAKAESVKSGDWKSLAKCAKTLLDNKIKREEALKWINESIAIDRNYRNLTLLGDYYRMHFEINKAYESYVQALLSAKKAGKERLVPQIQWKICLTMGTENYLNYKKNTGNNN
jgi:Tfp pilus assembly protein PilF